MMFSPNSYDGGELPGVRYMADDLREAQQEDGRTEAQAMAESVDVLVEAGIVPLSEKWSDAARAAAVAARRSRKKGGDWKKAGRAAFFKSKEGHGISDRAARSQDRKLQHTRALQKASRAYPYRAKAA